MADAPAGGGAWWVRTADKVRLRVAVWPADAATEPAGTVLVFPGRTEPVEKYGRVARFYTAAGFAVLVIDWRGQGLSDRALPEPRLGHVGDFAEYQHDVAAALDVAEACAPPGPRFLLAHSMGGCIGLAALNAGLPVRAVAFSAPMWGINLTPMETVLARTNAFLAPRLGLGTRLSPRTSLDHQLVGGHFEDNTLTTDRATWEYMKAQLDRHPELALGGPTILWLRAALAETARLAALPGPDLPAYTACGSHDRVVSRRAIRRRMADWPGGRLAVMDGAKHEILMERRAFRQPFLNASLALFRAHA